MAVAAAAIGRAMAEYERAGGISFDTKSLGGRTRGAVAEIALAQFGEFDFDRVAMKEGPKAFETENCCESNWGRRLPMPPSAICSATR